MKKIAFAAAVLALGTVSASAADMAARYTKAPVAVAAVYNWTGFYIGADVGYGWGRSTGTLTNAAGLFPVNYSLDPSGVLAVDLSASTIRSAMSCSVSKRIGRLPT